MPLTGSATLADLDAPDRELVDRPPPRGVGTAAGELIDAPGLHSAAPLRAVSGTGVA